MTGPAACLLSQHHCFAEHPLSGFSALRVGQMIRPASMLRIPDQKRVIRELARSRQQTHFEARRCLLSIQSLELNFQFRHARAK